MSKLLQGIAVAGAIAGIIGLIRSVAAAREIIVYPPPAEPTPDMVLVRNKYTGQTVWIFRRDLEAYLAGDWVLG